MTKKPTTKAAGGAAKAKSPAKPKTAAKPKAATKVAPIDATHVKDLVSDIDQHLQHHRTDLIARLSNEAGLVLRDAEDRIEVALAGIKAVGRHEAEALTNWANAARRHLLGSGS